MEIKYYIIILFIHRLVVGTVLAIGKSSVLEAEAVAKGLAVNLAQNFSGTGNLCGVVDFVSQIPRVARICFPSERVLERFLVCLTGAILIGPYNYGISLLNFIDVSSSVIQAIN